MKREKMLSCLIAGVLAFCLGFGGAACMVTGLDLPVEWIWLACGCALAAVLAAACLSLKWGWLVLSGVGLLMLLGGSFWEQAKALVRDVMAYYDRAYGIGIPGWLAGETVTTEIRPLLLIAGAVTVAAVWTILRRKRAYLAVGAALLPLAACLVVTDTVPDLWAIFLLLLGLVLLMMTQSVRRRDAAEGNRLAGILALPVLAALGLLFFLVPRGNYAAPDQMDSFQEILNWFTGRLPYVGQTSEGELVVNFGDALSDEVDLAAIGPKNSRTTPVMEVTAQLSGTVYLRGRDFDIYDGLRWTATEDRTEEGFGPPEDWTHTIGQVSVKTLGYRGQYYLPYYPMKDQTLVGGMVENSGGAMEYSFQCRTLDDNWQTYWSAGMWTFGESAKETPADERYLALPVQTRQRAEAILGTFLPSDGADALGVVQAIGDYVRNSAEYSLNTEKMPGSESDFAMWFLEESDTGYCVHFASAATVLLRAAGIPARYVEGYVTAVQGGKTTVVREQMAHAWVEYYLPGVGWVILDPTPGIDDTPVETTEPEQTTEATVQQTSLPSTEETTLPQQTTGAAQSDLHSTGGTSNDVGGSEKKALPGWFTAALWALVWIAAWSMLAVGQWALRRHQKMRRMYRGRVNAQVLARYREARRLARLRKIPLPDELQRLAEKARFSQHTLTKAELDRFDAFLRESVGDLRNRPWYGRLVFRLIFAAY